jgi:hypothetical protein
MLTTTMQLPCLKCLAVLITVDTCRMEPYRTANNRTFLQGTTPAIINKNKVKIRRNIEHPF